MIGGTRFIGAHAVRCLHDRGARLTVFDRGRNGNACLPPVEHVLDPAAEWPITRFPDTLRRDWDAVIHMGAMGRSDADAAVRMFRGRTRRLVLISSCDVYLAYGRLTGLEPGAPDPVPLAEDAPLRSALYPYRAMGANIGAWAHDYEKIHAERAVQLAHGLDWIILRLPKVYGPEDNGDLASVYEYAAVPDWRWTHGHVDNVAAAIALAATHAQARNDIFNVGEAHTPSMGQRLALLPERQSRAPRLPAFDFHQALVMDTTRIHRCLGYNDAVDECKAMQEQAMTTQSCRRTVPAPPRERS